MKRWWWVAGAAVWLAACALAVYVSGWHVRTPAIVGFGATADQCAAVYGFAKVVTANKVLVSPRTRGYVAAGWSIIVGFDENGHAEQFVYSVASIGSLFSKRPVLSAAEQEGLLDKSRDSSKWTLNGQTGNGPVWSRADGEAYASYIIDAREVVIMNKQAMERHIKRLNQPAPGPDQVP